MALFGIVDDDSSNPNYNYGPLLNSVGIAMMCLSGIAVILRFLSRKVARQPIKLDDYLIIAGLIFSWSVSIIEIVGVKYGLGRHIQKASPADIKQILNLVYAAQIMYILAVATIKFSIIAFIRRVFDVSSTRVPAYVIAGIIMSWLIALELLAIFACHPIHGYWDKTISSTCINTRKFYWGIGIPNIITDAVLIVFPLPMVWKLQMALSQKIALSGIFTLGVFIVIIAFIHIFTVNSIESDPDITWVLVPDALWNGIECNIGTVLACLSSMRPLLRLLLGEVRKITTGKQSLTAAAEPGTTGNTRDNLWSGIKRTDNLTISSFSRLHDDDNYEGSEMAGNMELGEITMKTRVSARV